MKLYPFPQAPLEKAIAKRMLTLPSPHKEWFSERWAQKPYKKSFIEHKAMPLITLLAKGKSWTDEEFNAELAAMFTRDLSLCRRVPARRQLSFSQRLLEATARLFSRVL